MSNIEVLNFRQFVLSELRRAARQGLRCPTNAELRDMAVSAGVRPTANGYPSDLAYLRKCRVEVYGQNWRVVEIDGMRTAEYKPGAVPYVVIQDGKRVEIQA